MTRRHYKTNDIKYDKNNYDDFFLVLNLKLLKYNKTYNTYTVQSG